MWLLRHSKTQMLRPHQPLPVNPQHGNVSVCRRLCSAQILRADATISSQGCFLRQQDSGKMVKEWQTGVVGCVATEQAELLDTAFLLQQRQRSSQENELCQIAAWRFFE